MKCSPGNGEKSLPKYAGLSCYHWVNNFLVYRSNFSGAIAIAVD
ncbi:hypothetical protein [[Limnothrix rosea] IAM M-220]|nr:hypothetical protein [[Limnothrix rosea] IAM M-220]